MWVIERPRWVEEGQRVGGDYQEWKQQLYWCAKKPQGGGGSERQLSEALVQRPPKLLSKNWAMICLFCILSFCFLFHYTSWPLYVCFSTSMMSANKSPASASMIHFTSVSQMCLQLLVGGEKRCVLNQHKCALMNSIYFREVLTCNKRWFLEA